MAENRKVAVKAERSYFLAELRKLGVTSLHGEYDGYGDSGNVEDIGTFPKITMDHDFEARLQDFIWSVAYNLYPGFENNCGGLGTVTWDITKDKIDVEHGERVEDIHWDTQEDV